MSVYLMLKSLSVQGIAYRISRNQMSRLSSSSGFRTTTVNCQKFTDADSKKQVGSKFTAFTLVAKEQYRASHLMPSMR